MARINHYLRDLYYGAPRQAASEFEASNFITESPKPKVARSPKFAHMGQQYINEVYYGAGNVRDTAVIEQIRIINKLYKE